MEVAINGFDITQYIAHGGFSWQRNDIDGQNSGRSVDTGTLIRDRLSIKIRLDITLIPLEQSVLSPILTVIEPEFVNVRYVDPQRGLVIKQMYSNNVPAQYLLRRNGKDLWSGVTFPLIER